MCVELLEREVETRCGAYFKIWTCPTCMRFEVFRAVKV